MQDWLSAAKALGNYTNTCRLGDVYNDGFISSAVINVNYYMYIHCLSNIAFSILHYPFLLQLHVLMFLLGMGADWRMVDKDGDTLLHFACMKKIESAMHDKTLEYLLCAPAFAGLKDSQNVRGDTPLMIATRCGLVLYFCPLAKLYMFKDSTYVSKERVCVYEIFNCVLRPLHSHGSLGQRSTGLTTELGSLASLS